MPVYLFTKEGMSPCEELSCYTAIRHHTTIEPISDERVLSYQTTWPTMRQRQSRTQPSLMPPLHIPEDQKTFSAWTTLCGYTRTGHTRTRPPPRCTLKPRSSLGPYGEPRSSAATRSRAHTLAPLVPNPSQAKVNTHSTTVHPERQPLPRERPFLSPYIRASHTER